MTKLNLTEKGIKELNEKINEQMYIEEMDLSINEFEEIKFIDQMRALRYLNFSKNKLVTMNLEPTSFESLTMLDLSENQLTNIPTLKSMN